MGKRLFIAEKPSVAQEFARALKVRGGKQDGYIETEDTIVTWCVGHLVSMSYPEAYDPLLKKWSMDTIPFFPAEWKYEVIPSVKKQFQTVKKLLTRKDVEVIYICTDSGREGEYIYRLVDQMAGVKGKTRLRVWIDSQTEEEILKGIRQAKDWSAYDNLSDSAYLRAKEDYLMGINFSRALTLRFGPSIAAFMKTKYSVVSVGRVMTCVLGMVVRREREIRSFEKTTFYRVVALISLAGGELQAEWRATETSRCDRSALYKDSGFLRREDAEALAERMRDKPAASLTVAGCEKKKETKYPPLLFNLAELQNTCSRIFKISPDETLRVAQELYEKKMVTYPRTDARVLSSAVAKEIDKNLRDLANFGPLSAFSREVLSGGAYQGIGRTRYTNDKQITDHYAIIPTGQGLGSYEKLSGVAKGIYELICRRFLSIFYPPAVYRRFSLDFERKGEHFFASLRFLEEEGYLAVAGIAGDGEEGPADKTSALCQAVEALKKGQTVTASDFEVREGETSPPRRYTSGSLILAMENAGQLIEDEDLRSQIKGSGIGTSATRAEILKKLVSIQYLKLARKTQVVTPEKLGEAVYEVVAASMRQMLNPELTASWEKGLTYVAEGTITPDEYMQKLQSFVAVRTDAVKQIANPSEIQNRFLTFSSFYASENTFRPKRDTTLKTGGRKNGSNHNKTAL